MNRLVRVSLTVVAVTAIAATAVSITSTLTGPGAVGPAAVQSAVPGAADDPQLASAPQFLADTTPDPENLYKPITPCKLADTRSGTGVGGTPIGGGQIRDYYVGGTAGFTPQGGTSGGCGVPIQAVAIAAVVTAVGATHSGYLRAYPVGAAEPAPSILSYSPLTSGVGLTQTVKAGVAQSLRVRNYGGPTDLVIDVHGYYVQAIHAIIDSAGGIISATPRVLSAVRTGTGSYDVTIDREVRTCTINTNADGSGPYIVNGSETLVPNVVHMDAYNSTNGSRVDIYFELNVSC